ncbi:MAG: hypothetical protein ACRD2A_16435 [Vicinamibacterales bacterium]
MPSESDEIDASNVCRRKRSDTHPVGMSTQMENVIEFPNVNADGLQNPAPLLPGQIQRS